MTFMSIVFLFPTAPGARGADMNYASVVLVATLLLSVVWYYLPWYTLVCWPSCYDWFGESSIAGGFEAK